MRLVKPHRQRREVRPKPEIDTVTHGKWLVSVSVRTESRICLFLGNLVISIVAGASLCFSQCRPIHAGSRMCWILTARTKEQRVMLTAEDTRYFGYARTKGHANCRGDSRQCYDPSQAEHRHLLPALPPYHSLYPLS